MQKIAITIAVLIIALFTVSCGTTTQGGQGVSHPSKSALKMPPAWGGQYGGR